MVDVVDNFAGIGFRWCLCNLVGNTLFWNAVGAVHLGFCMLVSNRPPGFSPRLSWHRMHDPG